MFFTEYITDNYVMLFELLGLFVTLEISAHISARMKRLTRAVVGLLFLEALCFSLEQRTQSFPKLSPLRPLLTATVYTLYPLILLLLMHISIPQMLPTRRLLLLLAPELISVPLYFTSQWTGLVFYFSEDNYYGGGPLSWLPYIVFGFYGLVFLAQNIRFFRRYARVERILLCYIVFGPMVGMVLYYLNAENRDYSALFCSAIVMYYIFVYIHMSKTDPLTSLCNRQSYYQDMKNKDREITAVLSVDMNELKYWNDTQGHEAGDLALRTVARVLREQCGRNGTPYRVGGDEFIFLYCGTGEKELLGIIAAMREQMSATPYVCAFGYAMRAPGEDLQETVRRADEKMYEDKAALKRQVLAEGGELHPRQD